MDTDFNCILSLYVHFVATTLSTKDRSRGASKMSNESGNKFKALGVLILVIGLAAVAYSAYGGTMGEIGTYEIELTEGASATLTVISGTDDSNTSDIFGSVPLASFFSLSKSLLSEMMTWTHPDVSGMLLEKTYDPERRPLRPKHVLEGHYDE